MFVIVTLMLEMQMTIMKIVGVPIVGDPGVATILVMGMRMRRMGLML